MDCESSIPWHSTVTRLLLGFLLALYLFIAECTYSVAIANETTEFTISLFFDVDASEKGTYQQSWEPTLKNATVTLLQDGKIVAEDVTGSSGWIPFRVEPGEAYTVTIEHQCYDRITLEDRVLSHVGKISVDMLRRENLCRVWLPVVY